MQTWLLSSMLSGNGYNNFQLEGIGGLGRYNKRMGPKRNDYATSEEMRRGPIGYYQWTKDGDKGQTHRSRNWSVTEPEFAAKHLT